MDKTLNKYIEKNTCVPSPLDARDYSIDCLGGVESQIPKTFRLRGMKVLNQGFIGSCVAHACATAMGYGEMVNNLPPHNFSRGFIYGHREDESCAGEGMHTRHALKQLLHYGDCEYCDFPYNEKYPDVKAKIDNNKEFLQKKAEPFKIKKYFRCYSNEEIKLALMNVGAVVICVPLYDNFASECPLPPPNVEPKSHHAMCVVGWDETGWIVQNSWSSFWGKKGGFVHLPYDYPVSEFWGIEINTTLPAPTKETFGIKITCMIKRIISKIKIFFKGEKE